MKKLIFLGFNLLFLFGGCEVSLEESAEKKDPFENWQTYRNDELGIEFQYPVNFHFDAEDSTEEWIVFRGYKDEDASTAGQSIFLERKAEKLENYRNEKDDSGLDTIVVTETGEIKGYNYTKGYFSGMGDPGFIAIEYPQVGSIVEISVVFDSGEILNGIISSLRLTQ